MTAALLLHRADGALPAHRAIQAVQPDGHVLRAQAGDALFVPQGAPIARDRREHVARICAVQDLPA